jgi:hypothetical protein
MDSSVGQAIARYEYIIIIYKSFQLLFDLLLLWILEQSILLHLSIVTRVHFQVGFLVFVYLLIQLLYIKL